MNKFYRLLPICIACFLVSSVNANTDTSWNTVLVSLGFQALKVNDVSLVQPLIMTEMRYRQLVSEMEALNREKPQEELTDDQLKKLEMEAQESLDNSFRIITEILDKLGFNWDKAVLSSTIVTKPRVEGEVVTKWIKYTSDDPRTRLDISYVIESENNRAMITLDDVFRINGERYLAGGYRFRAYEPSKIDVARVDYLVIAYHLNTRIPRIE